MKDLALGILKKKKSGQISEILKRKKQQDFRNGLDESYHALRNAKATVSQNTELISEVSVETSRKAVY